VHLFSNDLPENWIEDFWFEGDKLIKNDEKKRFASMGIFSPILKLTRDNNGVLVGVRDIRLK
jgi:hypothetical protein